MVFFHDYTSAWSSTTPPLDENLRLRSSLLIAPTASEPYTSAGPSVIAPPEENLRIYTQAGSSVIALPEENLRMGLPSSETLHRSKIYTSSFTPFPLGTLASTSAITSKILRSYSVVRLSRK